MPLFSKDDLVATMRCDPRAPLACKLDWPMKKICYWGGDPCDSRPPAADEWADPWGVFWRKESPDPDMMPFPVGHPLDEALENLDRWQPPTVDAPGGLFADPPRVRPEPDLLLTAEHPFALFERAWLVAGMQNLLEAMADHPARVDALFELLGAFEDGVARRYIKLGVEAAWIADDYGMSASLMFSPAMWRRFIRPHLKRLVDRYHEAGALVILHSCGNVTPLVDEFLELGVDVLDPLQPRCNDLAEVRRKTAGRMCLCGGVEASLLLSDDIERTIVDTREMIGLLGGNGGYIVGPDDEWMFPPGSANAMMKTVEAFRTGGQRAWNS
jgi:uroporphyrinogen decarboxylase